MNLEMYKKVFVFFTFFIVALLITFVNSLAFTNIFANTFTIDNGEYIEYGINSIEEDAHKIKVKVNGFEGEQLKIGYHYGDKQYILDSIQVDKKGWAVLEGDEALDGGIYFVVVPDHGYFEFIVSEQEFSLETTIDDYVNSMKVKDSKENEVFYEYLKYISAQKKKSKTWVAEKEAATGEKEKEAILEKLKNLDVEVKAYQETFNQKYGDTFYGKYLKAFEEIKVPEKPADADSTFAFKYYKSHFFDNIDFSEDRFARTPLIQKKVDQYLEKLVYPIPDSINVEIDRILEKAKASPPIFKYLTVDLLNKYANSKIMGMDAVYVHLVDSYYSAGQTDWVDSVQLFKIKDRAAMIRPNLIGKKAPNFRLMDDKDKYHALYNMESPYIVLYFWDPDCGHCKKSTPKVVNFYKKYKEHGVKVITITTEHEQDKWYKHLAQHDMPLLNLRDFEYKSNFRRLYDVSGTPRIFILDKDKKIIAKRLGADQLGNFMDKVLNLNGKNNSIEPIEMKEDNKGEH